MKLKHDNPQKPRIYQKKKGGKPVGPEYQIESRAPYNFVPLPDKIVWANPPVFHDVYNEDTYTGSIQCDLVTKSPVYVRGMLTSEQFSQQGSTKPKDLKPAEKEKHAHFFSTDPEQKVPVIPGSSLRGMLRQIVEIAGFGRVRYVADQPTFTFRAVAVQGQDPLQGPYENVLGKYGRNVQAGYIKQSGESWEVEPAQTPKQAGWNNEKWDKWVKIVDDDVTLKGFVHFNDTGYKPQVIPVSFDHGIRVPKKNRRKGKWDRPSIQVATPGTLKFEGILVTSGNMAETGGKSPRQNHAIVLPRDKSRNPIPVPNRVVDAYRKGMTTYQEENLDAWAGEEWGVFADDKPVFFVEENGEVAYIGHNPNFRIPARLLDSDRSSTPLDFVPEGLRKEEQRRPDLSDAIFGWVEEGDTPVWVIGSGEDKREIKSFAGRVFVSNAQLKEGDSDIWFSQVAIIPKILAGPKPSTFQHYLVQNKVNKHDPDVKMKLAHYGTSPKETQIRGYKFYWHKGSNPPIESKADELKWDEEKGQYKNESQLTRIRPLKAGVNFSFEIHFENLRPEELGALLWALELPGDDAGKYYHKIGMGKPYGMGAVYIKPTLMLSQRVKLLAKTDDSKPQPGRYDKLFADQDWYLPRFDNVDTLPFVTAFTDHVLAQLFSQNQSVPFNDLEQIQTLLEMLRWRDGDKDWLEQTRYMEIEHQVSKNETINEYAERPVLPEPMAVVGQKRTSVPVQSKPVTSLQNQQSQLRHQAGRQTGTVKFFKAESRYGFIILTTGGRDIFVHQDGFASGLSGLYQGQKVNFMVEPDGKGGFRAIDVRLDEN